MLVITPNLFKSASSDAIERSRWLHVSPSANHIQAGSADFGLGVIFMERRGHRRLFALTDFMGIVQSCMYPAAVATHHAPAEPHVRCTSNQAKSQDTKRQGLPSTGVATTAQQERDSSPLLVPTWCNRGVPFHKPICTSGA